MDIHDSFMDINVVSMYTSGSSMDIDAKTTLTHIANVQERISYHIKLSLYHSSQALVQMHAPGPDQCQLRCPAWAHDSAWARSAP